MSKPIEMRDEKGALTLSSYDELNRPTHAWARDKSGYDVTLRQKMLYDTDDEANPEDRNLKGKLYKQYDEAGLTTIAAYDFKGQVPEKIRKVIKNIDLLSVFTGPPTDWAVEAYRVNWDTSTDSILDAKEYTTSMEYDALGRVTKMTYPEDVETERKELVPSYNRSGALESVVMDGDTYVERIAYNARGQKILAAYGNGMMTRYVYRTDNFRLLRMKTEGYEKDGLVYEKQSGTTRQNFTYEYDLSGNIISIKDTTTGCGVGGSNELEREFEYDALYRLLSATGRETAGSATKPWRDRYRPNDNTQSRAYTQYYDYDKLGNIQELQHVATGGNFTRAFNYESEHNKLQSIEIGANEFEFDYDVNGNMILEGSSRHFAYDYADRLKAFYIQATTEEPSTYTQYFYDAGGNRVKKISRVQGGSSTRTTVYIDGIFEHTIAGTADAIPDLEIGPWVIGYGTGEQNTLHIMDGSSRIATRRLGDALGDTTPAIKYNLEDHLGSSTLLLSTDGTLLSKEEYYPFGETSFGSYGKKRYRFCGKEKDDESGLYYYGLRYYNPWTCRFINIDPLAGKYPFYTPYQYAGNKPINAIDVDGAEDQQVAPIDGGQSPVLQGDNTIVVPKPNVGGPEIKGNNTEKANAGNSDINDDGEEKDLPLMTNVYELFESGEYNSDKDWNNLGENVELGPKSNELYHPLGIEADEDRYTHMDDLFLANNNITPENFYDVMMGGFKSGTGPENYQFSPDSPVSQSFINSDIVQEAYNNFMNQNAGNGENPNDLVPWSGHVNLPLTRGAAASMRGMQEYGTALSPEHFVASAYVSLTPLTDGTISVFIFNVTSLGSGSENSNDQSSPRNTNNDSAQPYTNISQSIYLVIPLFLNH